MLQLILGLLVFFGIHSISIVALPLRNQLAAKSEIGWKLFYSIISLIGIVLIVRGYVDLKHEPTVLYVAPVWLHYVAAVFLLPAFILSCAPYFPGRISRLIAHPQLVALITWAFCHLLVNGAFADLLLFGGFLLWALADRLSMMNRTTRLVPGIKQSSMNDVILVLLGLVVYVVIVFWLHELLFGVRPLS